MVLSLLEKLDKNIEARRARVRAYQELLGSDPRLKLISHQSGSACLNQVVRVLPGADDDDRSTRLIEALREAGYEVQGSYVPIHLLPYGENYVCGRLSNDIAASPLTEDHANLGLIANRKLSRTPRFLLHHIRVGMKDLRPT